MLAGEPSRLAAIAVLGGYRLFSVVFSFRNFKRVIHNCSVKCNWALITALDGIS